MVITINSVSEHFDGLYRNRQFQAASDLLDNLNFQGLSDQDLLTYVAGSRRYLFRLLVWNRFVTRVYNELLARNNSRLALYLQELHMEHSV